MDNNPKPRKRGAPGIIRLENPRDDFNAKAQWGFLTQRRGGAEAQRNAERFFIYNA